MYITLQSIKRNLGLFNFTIEDLFIISFYGLTFTLLFLLGFYQTAIVVISLGVISLCPIDFSKTNRIYKLVVLFVNYIMRNKKFYYYKKVGENN